MKGADKEDASVHYFGNEYTERFSYVVAPAVAVSAHYNSIFVCECTPLNEGCANCNCIIAPRQRSKIVIIIIVLYFDWVQIDDDYCHMKKSQSKATTTTTAKARKNHLRSQKMGKFSISKYIDPYTCSRFKSVNSICMVFLMHHFKSFKEETHWAHKPNETFSTYFMNDNNISAEKIWMPPLPPLPPPPSKTITTTRINMMSIQIIFHTDIRTDIHTHAVRFIHLCI